MKFLDVTLQNYGPFVGEHTFRLSDRGLVLVLGKNLDDPNAVSNGAGKSSLLESVDWCLFGDVPRGDVAASIVNDDAAKGCLVHVRVLLETDLTLHVRRGYAPNILESWTVGPLGTDKLTTLDVKETQKRIERALGMDRQVFHCAVFFGQTDEFRFAAATDGPQKEVLTKLLALQPLDEWEARVDVMLKQQQKAVNDASAARQSAAATLHTLSQTNLTAQIQQWEATNAVDVQRAEHVVQQAEQAVAAALAELEQAAAAAQVALPPAPTPPTSPAWSAAVEACQKAEGQLAVLRDSVASAYRLRAQMQEMQVGTCRTCQQEVTGEHLADEVEHLTCTVQDRTAELQEAEAAAQLLRNKRDLLQKDYAVAQAAFQKEQGARAAAEIARSAAQTRLAQVNLSGPRSMEHLTWARNDLTRAKAVQNPYTALAAQNAQRIADAQKHMNEATAWLKNAEYDREHMEFWKAALGNAGLRSYILDSRVEEMTNEANRWVKLLTGDTMWISFETTKAVGKGSKAKLVDKFNIKLFMRTPDGRTKQRNFASYCGGEKQKVSLGIDFGLARLVAKRASRACDLLVLDEVFKHLDPAGREAVARMLKVLASEKSSVFVVDHDTQFQSSFENVVVVQKQHGRSTVIEAP